MAADRLEDLRGAGRIALTVDQVVLKHAVTVLERTAYRFVGFRETHALLQRLKETNPALHQAVADTLDVQSLTEVLKRLLREQVPVRQPVLVLEALVRWAASEPRPAELTERVRQELCCELFGDLRKTGGSITYFSIGPAIEKVILGACQVTSSGDVIAPISIEDQRRILEAIGAALSGTASPLGGRPVVVTRVESRRLLRDAIAGTFPDLTVLSYAEMGMEGCLCRGTIDLEDELASRV